MTRLIILALILFTFAGERMHAAGRALHERAKKGDASAQVELGWNYFSGLGISKDSAEAVRWWRKAAEQGAALGQYGLGLAFVSGDGVARDSAEAAKWFRRAAEQGLEFAQYPLGLMYAEGEGVPKDDAEAVKWFRKAADQGHADAEFELGEAYAKGNGVLKDANEALKWLRKAANHGSADAQFNLSVMYTTGDGVEKSHSESVKWVRMAANQGHEHAQFYFGEMLRVGVDGVPKDGAEAVKWYRLAAEQGHVDSQLNLGLSYLAGDGVEKDSKEAVKWYRMAAEQNEPSAQFILGTMMSAGEGVAKDQIEGLAWVYLAAASNDERAKNNLSLFEGALGGDARLAAQQRSKEIVREIEARKSLVSSPGASDSIPRDFPSVGSIATGSGAIVSATGHILTAAHVVAGASNVRVLTAEGMRTAIVVRIDEANDLAVLKLSGGTYSPLPIAPSRSIRLGQTVATIGFPNIQFQGRSAKVTRGEISSLNGFGDDPRAWQISVPVQTGNSGGPLLDEYGNLIGVVVSKLGLKAASLTGDLPQNVNYAVKSAYALALLEPYLEDGTLGSTAGSPIPQFEDMVAKAQDSVVLILVY